MTMAIPRRFAEFLLLGPEDDRRQLQDSPILGDVWMEFAKNPAARLDLLVTPYLDYPSGTLATELAARFGPSDHDRDVAYLQGVVAARLSFPELVQVVVPLSDWWKTQAVDDSLRRYFMSPQQLEIDISVLLHAAFSWFKSGTVPELRMRDIQAHKRFVALAGLYLWAGGQEGALERATELELLGPDGEKIPALAKGCAGYLSNAIAAYPTTQDGTIWTVSLNRRATPALTKSVPAVKADAARRLFTVDCSKIAWAVLDSGIAAGHPAFRDERGRPRVVRSFDFTSIRQIISLDNRRPGRAKLRLAQLLHQRLKTRIEHDKAEAALKEIAEDAARGRSIDWKLVEPFIEIDPGVAPPDSNHGTHVAGIIGARDPARPTVPAPPPATVPAVQAPPPTPPAASNTEVAPAAAPPPGTPSIGAGAQEGSDGMCPDIRLFDFRVLGATLRETEFAIIAALQYIRYMNDRNSFLTIHGANLSLSIPHDVRNFACGRTPICNECERLVNGGVVVVAAAGNRGYHNFETQDGNYEGYAAFSITDPGNAEGVITVGSTHRHWPHTYGVSFFSSRGPTGDGRLKPDLVAPGEKIRAPLADGRWGDLDGTSMAAPHVSGAAAMLMGRYSELIGQPRRIKQILCDTATDLGRERSFQGRGMLDVLRALQKI